ncbi:uncharacterized protein TRAVEDRAFT_71095 [Trametes versicolor FP-101664 SS1]|uniref:uncharacterized protein n=1 Tax=Trametes versicolor (strain FP-101664) TaxID=717944 RepID=UPI0004621519|nr:uncharacterized protein TRAVEDRAFT_71095 [Trametes versicolor FP-101664 SS1]EIW60817.1 hypothetical protein TRAVEDRAFT_71095 [Trametes versicolor FP-101664 SS1]
MVSKLTMLLLNDDVALMIVDNMSSEESKNALCALSQTSRRFRDLCVPVLRSTARLDSVRCPSRISHQIPEWMRPYLRELTLRDICGDRTSRYREYPWSRDPIMCSTYEGDAIAALLPSIPHLRKVVIISSHDPPPCVSFVYGISWAVVKAIISARGLQELDLDGHFFCLNTFAPDPDFTPAPLTTFRCTIPHRRLVPVTRAFSTQTEALAFVLERLRHSLEHLSLTIDIAPLDMIRDADWPRLRSLHLAGDILPTTHSLPWVSILRHMPRLRVLSLRAAVPDDIDHLTTHQIVWPPDTLLDTLPWPELEDLEVTYPDPEDRLFSHLPSTLRSLSIGRFAFFAHHNWALDEWEQQYSRPQDVPMPRASEVLQIARKCNTPNLRTLKLEYLADGDASEDELLACIPAAFPRLESLRLCRYDTQDDAAAAGTALRVAQALSPLSHLRTFQVHLDAVPDPELARARRGCYYAKESIAAYVRELKELADVMAQTLGPSVEAIEMFAPPSRCVPFDVVRSAAGDDGSPGTAAHAEFGAEYTC